MCRIFGFRSILQSGVHQSLIEADNAIIHQSERHPDGWGVAYYKLGSPHLIKMDSQARESKIFQKISGVVSSNTVLAHIRKSTVGDVSALNTHPFQFGQWVFAHNGNLRNFDKIRDPLFEKIDDELKPFVFGSTDSEVLFYLLLSLIKKKAMLDQFYADEQMVPQLLREFVDTVTSVAGDLSESKGEYENNYLTFIMTNGDFLIGFQGGQKLRYSTHKTSCPEKSSCNFYNKICESRAVPGEAVHHLIISSEQIQNENVWQELSFGEFVGVHQGLKFFNGQIAL